MLRKLMMTTAALTLLTGSAFAQMSEQPKMTPSPSAPSATTAGKAQIVTQQTADQTLASKFKGTNVLGPNDEKVGDVSDILFDKDSKVLAYIIGVGGFLGIGAKDVAIAPASFQMVPANDRESMKLKLSMTKDELKNAPEFQAYKAPTPTTGQAPSRDRAPMTPPNQR